MRRRKFILALGGAAAWPLAVRAQQGERMRRVGVLLPFVENEPEGQDRFATFRQSLHELGWISGRNVEIADRWVAGDAPQMQAYAVEFARMAPDVVLGISTPVLQALRQEMRSIPIVFVGVSDPEGVGFVSSLARPGGNTTGFANFEAEMGGKWLQSLKEVAPKVTRIAVLSVGPRVLWGFVGSFGGVGDDL
jgi:putative tryptophan/tyrosine transport system substrate-binding protein